MQGQGQFSYRHLWRRGLYGTSRYWLQDEAGLQSGQFQLRNFTRSLTLERSSTAYLSTGRV